MLDTEFICRDNPTNTITNGCVFSSKKDSKFISLMIKAFEKQLKKSKNSYGPKWIFNNILNKYFSLKGFNKQDFNIQTIDNVKIYSFEYFCPFNLKTKELKITEKTISIHHYCFSWNKWKKENGFVKYFVSDQPS